MLYYFCIHLPLSNNSSQYRIHFLWLVWDVNLFAYFILWSLLSFSNSNFMCTSYNYTLLCTCICAFLKITVLVKLIINMSKVHATGICIYIVHKHMYTHIHTRTYMRKYTHTYTHIHACTYIHIRTCTHTHRRTHTHTPIHTPTHTHTQTDTHRQTDTQTDRQTDTHTI